MSQVLHHFTMPSLVVALVQSSWMTCFAMDARQGFLTAQGPPVRELGHMTSVQMVTVKTPVCDVWNVSD